MASIVLDVDADPDRRAFRARVTERLNKEAASIGEMRGPPPNRICLRGARTRTVRRTSDETPRPRKKSAKSSTTRSYAVSVDEETKPRVARASPVYVIKDEADKAVSLTPDGLALVTNLASYNKPQTYIASKLGLTRVQFERLLGTANSAIEFGSRGSAGMPRRRTATGRCLRSTPRRTSSRASSSGSPCSI